MTSLAWVETAERHLIGARRWVAAWTPWAPLRWCGRHRWAATAIVLALLAIMVSTTAWADTGTGATADGGNPLISWMHIKDSHGGEIAKYTLTLNQGNWASIGGGVDAAFANIDSWIYELNLCVTATALWLIKFLLEFGWLDLFATPFVKIGQGVQEATNKFGLLPSALAVLAIIAACTVLVGRVTKAYSNIAMGLLMVGLAATVFANPLSELVGQDGMLAKGRDTGLQIATTVSGDSMHTNGSGADVDPLIGSLADRFLRQPTQMINLGMVSDSISRKCEQAWTDGINGNHGDKLKDDMQGCDKKYGDKMHRKTMGRPASILVSLQMCSLLGAFLVFFACFTVWHVVRSAVHAMLYATLAPPAFALGVIPGGPQTFAWKTVLDCLMAFAAMVIYTAAFGAYNVVLDKVFQKTNNPIEAIFLTALVLAFGFAFFGPLRRMLDNSRDKLATKFGNGSLPSRQKNSWLAKAADMSQLSREVSRQFGWDDLRNPGGGKGGGHRGAAKVESESADSSESSDSVASSGDSQQVVSDSADGGAVVIREDNSTDTSGGVGGGSAAGAGGGSAQDVAYIDSRDRASAAHDKLAEAIRIQRGTRGGGGGKGPSGPSGGGGVRYSLSEAA